MSGRPRRVHLPKAITVFAAHPAKSPSARTAGAGRKGGPSRYAGPAGPRTCRLRSPRRRRRRRGRGSAHRGPGRRPLRATTAEVRGTAGGPGGGTGRRGACGRAGAEPGATGPRVVTDRQAAAAPSALPPSYGLLPGRTPPLLRQAHRPEGVIRTRTPLFCISRAGLLCITRDESQAGSVLPCSQGRTGP